MILSVLDLVPHPHGVGAGEAIGRSLELAERAEGWGYRRVWYAEHHNMPTVVSTTPEILIALAGARTSAIRVGAGGVMLPNHAPLKVAESFKMLEALYPGRVDLGLGRAPGTDPVTAFLLRGGRGGSGSGAEDFPSALGQLATLGMGPLTVRGGTGAVAAEPGDVELPPIFLLGSGDTSARLAAELGLGFGFAGHFSELPPEGPMLAYRKEFASDGVLPAPHAILTLSVICADTDEEAERLASSARVAFARMRTGQRSVLLPPEEALAYKFSPLEAQVAREIGGRTIVGSPERVAERIASLARTTEADEIMVSTLVHGHEARLRSYDLVAQALASGRGVAERDVVERGIAGRESGLVPPVTA